MWRTFDTKKINLKKATVSWKAPFVWDAMPVREGAVYKGIPPVPLRDPGRSGEEGLNLGLARFFPS